MLKYKERERTNPTNSGVEKHSGQGHEYGRNPLSDFVHSPLIFSSAGRIISIQGS